MSSKHEYWCERHRDGEIDVVVCSDDDTIKAALRDGLAVQGYMSYPGLKILAQEKFPEADVWYTERNGDPIGMFVPKGTDPDRLPSVAMDYRAFEWIDPDAEFGTGVVPKVRVRWR